MSPSGGEVAFITTSQELKVVPLGGGLVRTLATDAGCCMRWGTDGFVYYSPFEASNIRRVPETGGAVEEVTTRESGSGDQGDFQILADRDVGVFTGNWTEPDPRIDAIRLSTGERKPLTTGIRPYVTPTGHLVFGSLEGQILAAPFDADAMELTGPPVPVVEGVFVTGGANPVFSVSSDGSLIYAEGRGIAGGARLAVVDLEGNQRILPLAPRAFTTLGPSWSPDGESVVFSSESQIYTYDVVRKTTPRQITFEGTNRAPVYSPDGTRLAFSSTREGTDGLDLFVKDLTDDSPPTSILTLEADQLMMQWPTDTLIVFESGAVTNADLWMVDLSDPANPEARPYLTSEADLQRIVVSPDGRLAAYRSNESGTNEIYIRSFPNAGERTVVSRGGGAIPYWSPDGRTLYYDSGAGRPYMAARLQREPVPAVLSLDTLFTPAGMVIEPFPGPGLHPDGDRFIFAVSGNTGAEGETTAPQRIILVKNFFEELKRLVPN